MRVGAKVASSINQGEARHISFIHMRLSGPSIFSYVSFRTTVTRVDIQVSQSVVDIENAKARCDVVVLVWFHPPLKAEDAFKTFLRGWQRGKHLE